ncbi:tRNA lysidine(34) synthetase TilS [Francisellaceae bacterium]|nr:tRNA lysidine(34) synthetase TilS [Francisellaceae bacterium]
MLETFQSLLIKKNIQTLIIAYSGGIDSTVLLHLSSQLQSDFLNVKAIHINHGISPNSNEWEKHCQQQCDQLNTPLSIQRIQTQPQKGQSIEAWAREERYSAFQKHAEQCSAIALGHHQEDQAETFLLQAIRGSGLPGLSAMPETKTFTADSLLVRPLLGFAKQQLIDYAHKNQLIWIEDESNTSTKFRRNALRHNIIPELEKISPQVTQTLARAAKHCAEVQSLLKLYVEQDLQEIMEPDHSLNVKKLCQKNSIQQKALFRAWCQTKDRCPPKTIQLTQILESLAHANSGWIYSWGNHTVGLYNNLLEFIEQSEKPIEFSYAWDGKSPLKTPNHQTPLTKQSLQERGLKIDQINWGNIIVRSRQPGDKFKPKSRQHAQSLKVLFQENNIPEWKRSQTTIIQENKCILAIYPFLF